MIGYGNSYFLTRKFGGVTPPAPQLLLDTYPNAAVAYSLRKLRTAYSGSAIRVRRSVDNAEQDIAFVGNDLDTTTMLDFVGYNLLTYSEDFTIATPVWNKFQSSITANVETAPDGTLTGDKLVEGAVSGFHYLDRTNYPITNGVIYNISVFLKQAERTKVTLVSAISGTNLSCRVDLTNGTISNNTFTNTPVVTAEANGWYRVSVTITSGTTSAAPVIRLFPVNALDEVNYLGDGTSGFYVWGAQLSQTSSVKTYQKTVATAGGNGFVTTWYDQSGNANNATQSTAVNQPQIVSSGAILTVNSKACMSLSLNNTGFDLGSTITVAASSYNSFVGKKDGAGTMLRALTSSFTDGYRLMNYYDNNYYLFAKAGSYIVSNSTDTTTSQILLTGQNVAGTMSIHKNGNIVATTLGSYNYSNTIGKIGTGASGSAYRLQEAVFYNSNQSTNRTGIESNINTFYTIY